MRSRNRWAKTVTPTPSAPRAKSCSTPPSTLKLRSGRRSGFPIENGLSKFSKKLGSLNPVPTEPRILVVGDAKASAAAR